MSPLLKKIILVLVLFAIALVAISIVSGKKKAALVGDAVSVPSASVTVVRAVARPMLARVALTGTLVAREEVLVGAEAEGLRITAVYADEGKSVKAGEVLADLARDTIDAQLAQNRAALAQARSQITGAQAELDEARSAYERVKTLRLEGYQTQAALDAREAALKTAASRLEAAKSGLGVVQAQGRELEAGLKRRYLRAPVDGVIARRTARLGQVVFGAGEPLFRIIEQGDIEFLAQVPEQEVPSMRIGQKARITLEGGPAIEGVVRVVSPEIDETTRLGRLRVALPHDPALKTGAFARAEVLVEARRALALPSRAIAYTTQGAGVMVEQGNVVHARAVETGIVDGAYTEITQGLAEGDRVVEKAGTFLRDGDSVTPVLSPDQTQAR